MNSYTISLNAAELRHAKYQGNFKWAVHEASRRWDVLWERFKVVPVRNRLRMLDDALMAELFGVLIRGVSDGGQPQITRLYEAYDSEFANQAGVEAKLDTVLNYIVETFNELLDNSPLASSPHFLMLFAATAHALVGIPPGGMADAMPGRNPEALNDTGVAIDNLEMIAEIMQSDEPPAGWQAFWTASKTTTQRIASRRVRFPVYYQALLPRPLRNGQL